MAITSANYILHRGAFDGVYFIPLSQIYSFDYPVCVCVCVCVCVIYIYVCVYIYYIVAHF